MDKKMKELMLELRYAHDGVKVHPFRLNFNEELVEDYIFLLDKLVKILKEICDKDTGKYNKLRWHISHDYRSCFWRIRREEFRSQGMQYLEIYLGVVHEFIETNNFDTYYLLSDGKPYKVLWDENTAEWKHDLGEEYYKKAYKSYLYNTYESSRKFVLDNIEFFGYNKEKWNK